jgi:hypothetical protein
MQRGAVPVLASRNKDMWDIAHHDFLVSSRQEYGISHSMRDIPIARNCLSERVSWSSVLACSAGPKVSTILR